VFIEAFSQLLSNSVFLYMQLCLESLLWEPSLSSPEVKASHPVLPAQCCPYPAPVTAQALILKASVYYFTSCVVRGRGILLLQKQFHTYYSEVLRSHSRLPQP